MNKFNSISILFSCTLNERIIFIGTIYRSAKIKLQMELAASAKALRFPQMHNISVRTLLVYTSIILSNHLQCHLTRVIDRN